MRERQLECRLPSLRRPRNRRDNVVDTRLPNRSTVSKRAT
jgi:hypothetical protein